MTISLVVFIFQYYILFLNTVNAFLQIDYIKYVYVILLSHTQIAVHSFTGCNGSLTARERNERKEKFMGKINVIETSIAGVVVIEPAVFGDERGWFYEAWSERDYSAAGLAYKFVQDNRSFSALKGTLRGIHFQRGDAAQAKLVWAGKGEVLDVAVDLRQGSPTYLQWEAVILTAENKRQFMIPRGFGHAFLALTDNVEFCYKADNFYDAIADGSIRYDDPDIGVDWGRYYDRYDGGDGLILSDKDRNAPFAKDTNTGFTYQGST